MAAVVDSTKKHRPGDWVVVRYGIYRILAQVLEDRGPLAADRRHVYRIRMLEDGEPVDFEVSESDITSFERGVYLEYLRRNLIAILEHGSPSRNPTRVWLTLDSRGELVHTFLKERGMMGGVVVPFHTLENGRIFLPMVDQVKDFLQDLGLSPPQADDLLRSLGRRPSPPIRD